MHPHLLGQLAEADVAPLVGENRLTLPDGDVVQRGLIAGRNGLANQLAFALPPLMGEFLEVLVGLAVEFHMKSGILRHDDSFFGVYKICYIYTEKGWFCPSFCSGPSVLPIRP